VRWDKLRKTREQIKSFELSSCEIVISSHCVFDENTFPFSTSYALGCSHYDFFDTTDTPFPYSQFYPTLQHPNNNHTSTTTTTPQPTLANQTSLDTTATPQLTSPIPQQKSINTTNNTSLQPILTFNAPSTPHIPTPINSLTNPPLSP